MEFDGSPGRTRTSDPAVNSRLLYRLSYRGTAALCSPSRPPMPPETFGRFGLNYRRCPLPNPSLTSPDGPGKRAALRLGRWRIALPGSRAARIALGLGL